MPVIRANREAIDDRFSVLGFSIRTEQPWYEVGLATDPSLFKPENRGRRTPRNFYSSRAQGPQSARRGEAVYLLPADVLQHFIGQPRLYFGLATYRDSAGSAPVHVQAPTAANMYVSLGGLTERGLRRLTSAANAPSAYGTAAPGSQAALTWGGDLSTAARSTTATPTPSTPSAPSASSGSPGATTRAPDPATAAALEYDDGFSSSLWQQAADPVAEAQEILLDPAYRSDNPLMAIVDVARFIAGSVNWFLGVPNTREFPHSAICQIRFIRDGADHRLGSGFYVGRNLVVTAAHVVAAAERAGVTQLVVVPGKNGEGTSRDAEFLGRTTVPLQASRVIKHERFRSAGDAFDIAVIKVDLNAPGGKCFRMADFASPVDQRVAVCGYAMESRGSGLIHRLVNRTINPDRQHMHGGGIRQLINGGETVLYDIQTLAGTSGSPVFQVSSGDRPTATAYAVHSDSEDGAHNRGCRLTDAKIAWIRAKARQLSAAVGMSTDDGGDESTSNGAPVVEAQEILLDPPYRSNDPAQSLVDHVRLLASAVPWFLGVPNTRGFPHSAICQFRGATSSGDDGFGSGFYIGRNLVLTAKHVVDGGPAQLILVPGKNGAGTGAANEFLGRFTVPNTNANVRKHPTLDLAIVKVPNNAPGGRWFAIEELTQSRPWGVAVCGYSMASNNTGLVHRLVNRTIDPDKQHLHGGRIISINDGDGSFAYDIQTLGGASGSPVYEVVPGSRPRVVAVGVHVSNNDRATNRGMRLTQAVITWIRQQANSLSAAVGLGFDGDEYADALGDAEPYTEDGYREPEPAAQGLDGDAATGRVEDEADTHAEAQQIPGTELRPVDIKLRTFIPSPAIYADLPMRTDRAFSGDGRGFQYSGGTSRAEIHARFEFSNGSSGSRPRLTVLDRHWGESLEYNTSDVVAVSGKPAWWRAVRSGARPIDRGTHAATASNLRAQLGGSSHEGIYSMAEGSVVVGLGVEGALPLLSFSPDIDVNLYVHLRVRNQKVQAKVRGSHDGFPASEIYVNQVRVYSYDPVAAGNGPTALVGTGNWDINVDTPWTDVGDASDVRIIGPVRIQGADSESFSADDAAAEAFAIPLDPGPGGRSISAAALQRGDLIVSTARHPVSYAIRAGTVSSVSHAMLYVGDGHVVEAVGSGVRRVPLATALSGAILAVAYRRSGITSAQAQAVADFAARQVGRPYNYTGAARHAVRITHPILSRIAEAIARGAGVRRDEAASFFCSELVYAAFEAAHVPLSTTPAADGTPASLPSLLGGTLGYVG
ncbi:MAG: trypsin-like peptidase domain-containing protein, partial [Silanimonas sp.]